MIDYKFITQGKAEDIKAMSLKKADHDIENNIVFWHEDEEDE